MAVSVTVKMPLLGFLLFLSLSAVVILMICSYMRTSSEINSLGRDLRFEGNATLMRVDENQGILLYDLKVEKSFHTDSPGIRERIPMNMTYADGEIRIQHSLFLQPLILNVATGLGLGLYPISFEGYGLLTIKSVNAISGLVVAKHDKIPMRRDEDRFVKLYFQGKNGTLIILMD